MVEHELHCIELAADDSDSAFELWMDVQRLVNPENPGSIEGVRSRLRSPAVPSRMWVWSRDADGPIGISSITELRRGDGVGLHGSVVLVEASPRIAWEHVLDHVVGIGRAAGATSMSFGARHSRVAQRELLVDRGGRLTERLVMLERPVDERDAADVDARGRVCGRPIVSLADRSDLAAAWCSAEAAWTADIPGETGEQDMSHAIWLAQIDTSPFADRSLMWAVLSDTGEIDAIIHLERHSIDPEAMEISMLGVAPHARACGLGRELKRWMHAEAWEQGVRRLQTINHAGNGPMERLNESLGYVPVEEFLVYELELDTTH